MPQAQPSAENARQNPNLYRNRESSQRAKTRPPMKYKSMEDIKNNPLRNKP